MKKESFEKLEKIKEELKEDRTAVIVTAISIGMLIGVLVLAILYNCTPLVVTYSFAIGVSTSILIACCYHYQNTKAKFKKALMSMELELAEEAYQHLLECFKELEQARENTVPLQEEPVKKAVTKKTTKKKN